MNLNKTKKVVEEIDATTVAGIAALLNEPGEKDVLQLHAEEMFKQNLEHRILWIDLEITIDQSNLAPTILDLEKQIIAWNREDMGIPVEERKPIKIFIYSFGGDLDATMSFVSIMQVSKTPIYTYNMGVAYSGGFLILVNGHKRFALRNSTGLYHEGSAQIQGSAEDVRCGQANYEKQIKAIKQNIVERTNIEMKTLNKYKDSQWYIPADQLVSLGVVDGLVDDIDQLC